MRQLPPENCTQLMTISLLCLTQSPPQETYSAPHTMSGHFNLWNPACTVWTVSEWVGKNWQEVLCNHFLRFISWILLGHLWVGFQIGHSNTLPVSLFRSTQAGPHLGVGGKALCLDQNQRWPTVRLSLSRMQYILLCIVQHLPVLEIGMLWCVSLSDTCSEEVTLNRWRRH